MCAKPGRTTSTTSSTGSSRPYVASSTGTHTTTHLRFNFNTSAHGTTPFQVYYEDADPKARPTSFSFVTPSLTTQPSNFPAYRIYTVDGDYPGSTWVRLFAIF